MIKYALINFKETEMLSNNSSAGSSYSNTYSSTEFMADLEDHEHDIGNECFSPDVPYAQYSDNHLSADSNAFQRLGCIICFRIEMLFYLVILNSR